MLARRARIKALAAVPVRKKLTQDSVESNNANNAADKEQKKDNESNINEAEQKEGIKDVAKIKVQKEEDVIRTEASERKEESSNNISEENAVRTEASERKEEDISSINVLKPEKQKNITSNSVSNREAIKDVAKIQKKTTNEEQNTVSLEESVTNKKSDSQELCSPLKQPNSQGLCTQVKPNSQESPYTGIASDKVTDQSVQKTIPPPDVPTAVDITSPTKLIQSRSCFMRPIPRLDSSGRIRKNSIQGSGASASESEDEHSKRVASVVPSRVRNDSVCSVQSNKESTTNDNQSSIPKIKMTQKKRMLISESARKLAEARREFLLKHENRTPDRSQLKMYDLIYYNPVTNPMKKLSIERKVQSITAPQPVEVPEEENEDDPSAIGTPQVKVGPDGQLIVDERSLVVEQTGVKGSDEMSETIIEDDSHSGGFYKRHKRSKDWPKWETFKFYRVLNVVGTDFLLMQTLFPNRSRQEIKQKYKKEERINRHLVEKALKYHQEFNTDMLEEQLAMLQKLEHIQDDDKSKKAPEKNKNNQSLTRIERKRKRRLVADSIGECEALSTHNETEQQETEDTAVSTTNEEINVEINGNTNDIQQQTRGRKNKARRSKKRVEDIPQEIVFDDYSSSTDADSNSSEEVYQLRPTRSGRLSKKIRKLQAPDPSTINTNDKNKSIDDETAISSHEPVEITEYVNTPTTNSGNTETSSDNIISMIPNINQMEPGALVIISKESAENPGNTILQVYMVASSIDSSTMVTPLPVVSAASENQSSEPLATKPENAESINIVDDTEE